MICHYRKIKTEKIPPSFMHKTFSNYICCQNGSKEYVYNKNTEKYCISLHKYI